MAKIGRNSSYVYVPQFLRDIRKECTHMKKRFLSIMMALCLALILLPSTASATGDSQENYVTLELTFGENVPQDVQQDAMAEYAGKTYASCSEANEAYMALFGIGWTSGGILNIIDHQAPLYAYCGTPGSVSMVTFTVHGSVPGFTSLLSGGNNMDCTVGGNHQMFRTSYTIQGVNNLDGTQAQITDGNIQAYVAGGYPSSFTKSGTLTIQNIEFPVPAPDSTNQSNRYMVIAASAAPFNDASDSDTVESASMIVENCTFHGYVYLYDNFDNRGAMTYTLRNNVFDCQDQDRAVFMQSNYGPAEVNLIGNIITAKTWVVDCNVAGADFNLQGNTITKTEDTRGAAVQFSNGSSFAVTGNDIISAGNAFWIHDGTSSITDDTAITITGNEINAKYLICDSGKASDQTWSGNTISPTTDVTQGRLQNPSSGKAEFQTVLDTTAAAVENTLTNYISVSGVSGLEGRKYPTFASAAAAIGSASGNISLEVNGQVYIGSQTSLDLSGITGLTGLTIRGADENAQIISGVDGNDIDGPTYCPILSVKLPEGAPLVVENLTFPDDLGFDSPNGTVEVRGCVFHGSISGYPQAQKISYLNNRFEFKGTGDFWSNNAYAVWYKEDHALDFVFTGNTVIGPRGVHIDARGSAEVPAQVDIQVDNNRFQLSDPDYPSKAIALQLVNHVNGDVSFSNNYVDAYMGVCFFKDLTVEEAATLRIANNYLVGNCKLYGSSEWNQTDTPASDYFAAEIVAHLTGQGSTVTPGHTEHNFENGACTICGQQQMVTPPVDPGTPPTGGSSSSEPSYSPVMDVSKGGSVKVNPRTPGEGDEVTITVDPDRGYEVGDVTVTDRSGRDVRVTAERDGTYTFEQPKGRVTIAVTFVREGTSTFFADVAETYWAYDEIAWAYENGYVNGVTATTFAPGASISRQQIWMILARIAGDDPADMAAARQWSIDNGISDGTNPGSAVTRQQLAALLYRYAQMMGYANEARVDLSSFPDAGSVASYAVEPMQWSVANSIVGGTTDGTLNPTGTATRAQFAVILYRFWSQIG